MVGWDSPPHVPSGWPEAVNAPGSEDWEVAATAWLLELIPEYRQCPRCGVTPSSSRTSPGTR